MKPVLGLDIGGTKCAVLLAQVDQGIRITDKIRFDTCVEKGFDFTLQKIYDSIDTLLARHQLQPGDLLAIGISCGGPLDSRRGLILSPPNLPGWDHIPLPAMLRERYGIPAYLQNDANACALVEWKLGAGRGVQDMVFLTMGTGMGAGIIAGGRLLCGASDMAGEVGHLRLSEQGPMGYGKAGSFEGYASGGGIALQARALTEALIQKGTPPAWTRDGLPVEAISAKEIAGYAQKGDPDALGLMRDIGAMLGKGLALLVDLLNPSRIVIGSIFVRCEALLRPSMEAALGEEALPHGLEGLQILPAETGESLGDLASIMAALHALGMDPLSAGPERDSVVLAHLDSLMARHPVLEPQKKAILQGYEMLRDCFSGGRTLLLCGNGGSCSDAQHILGELMKGFYLKRPLPQEQQDAIRAQTAGTLPETGALLQGALPAIVLSEHSTLVSAFANDVNADLVYAQQIIGYGRPGDVLLALSTSGNARNVLLAAQVARARGVKVLALTGGTGGALREASDAAIVVPGDNPAQVQELHLPVYHALCAMLESRFFAD